MALRWPIEVAEFLVEKGANVNAADDFGRTPLHVATSVDFPDMVRWLLQNGGTL